MNIRALALVATIFALAACGTEDPVRPDPARDPLPSWIQEVQPTPGQETSGTQIVEVRHRLMKGSEHVILEVDGVDVTSVSRLAPGVLHYDGSDPNSLVRLEPGRHTATVRHVLLTEGEAHRELDSFTWSFEIL